MSRNNKLAGLEELWGGNYNNDTKPDPKLKTKQMNTIRICTCNYTSKNKYIEHTIDNCIVNKIVIDTIHVYILQVYVKIRFCYSSTKYKVQ